MGPERAGSSDFRRVDVDVDDLGVRCEIGDVAGDPVGGARARRDDEITLRERVVGVLRAVHAHRPEVERMGRRETALAHECRDNRDAHELGQPHQLGRGARADHAAARQDDRPPRLPDELAGGSYLLRVSSVGGFVGGDVDAVGILEHDALARDVRRDVDEHRTRAPGRRDVKRLAKHPRQIGDGLQQKRMLDHGIVIPKMSDSWKESVPMTARGTWAVMTTRGTESM